MIYYNEVAKIDINNPDLRGLMSALEQNLEDINTCNVPHKSTALHLACQKGIPDAVKLLLQKNPDIYLKDGRGNSCIHRLLMHAFAKRNKNRPEDFIRCFNLLLEHEYNNGDKSQTNSQLLEQTTYLGSNVQELLNLKNSYELNEDLYSKLNLSIDEHVNKLKLRKKSSSGVRSCLMIYYNEVAKIDINNPDLRGLMSALEQNLEDINTCNVPHKSTALHLACQKGIPDAVKLLLQKNPDIYLKDSYGNSCIHRLLMHAFEKRNKNRPEDFIRCFNLLLEHEYNNSDKSQTNSQLLEQTTFLNKNVQGLLNVENSYESNKDLYSKLNLSIEKYVKILKLKKKSSSDVLNLDQWEPQMEMSANSGKSSYDLFTFFNQLPSQLQKWNLFGEIYSKEESENLLSKDSRQRKYKLE